MTVPDLDDQALADRIAAMIAAERAAQAAKAPEPPPLSYTYRSAAKATGLGVSTIVREVRAGRLKAKKVRGRVVILEAELRRFLADSANL